MFNPFTPSSEIEMHKDAQKKSSCDSAVQRKSSHYLSCYFDESHSSSSLDGVSTKKKQEATPRFESEKIVNKGKVMKSVASKSLVFEFPVTRRGASNLTEISLSLTCDEMEKYKAMYMELES